VQWNYFSVGRIMAAQTAKNATLKATIFHVLIPLLAGAMRTMYPNPADANKITATVSNMLPPLAIFSAKICWLILLSRIVYTRLGSKSIYLSLLRNKLGKLKGI